MGSVAGGDLKDRVTSCKILRLVTQLPVAEGVLIIIGSAGVVSLDLSVLRVYNTYDLLFFKLEFIILETHRSM